MPRSERFVFYEVSWGDYEKMLRIVGDGAIRVTYDQGMMEIFRPSLGHNSDAFHLGRVVDIVTEELELDVQGGGTTTHKRQDLDMGLSRTSPTGSRATPATCAVSANSF